MKARRNDPCPCGSGNKYKHCCENKRSPAATSRWVTLAIALVVLFGALLAVNTFTSDDAAQAGIGPPDGPAPPGKVWSYEHGHWHDAP